MVGYATSATSSFLPLEYELARQLCRQIYKYYTYDGKTQVTINGEEIISVVASFQNSKTKDLENLVRKIIKSKEYHINPAGEWRVGGFDADSGLSGRKIVVDNYGPNVAVGGGSFSGKDPTKVDRSGAYMARKIAIDYLKKFKAKEVVVKLAYAIGKKYPVMATALVDGESVLVAGYDLSPKGIRDLLGLDRPIYLKTASWGHFGRGFRWDS